MNEAVLKLLADDRSLQNTRAYFDSVLDIFPSLEIVLHANAKIVHRASFNSGAVKVQRNREGDLITLEKCALRNLLRDDDVDSDTKEQLRTIIERATKRFESGCAIGMSAYMNSRFLFPTFNVFERLLLIARHALTNCPRVVMPSNIENQLFPYMKSMSWSIERVKK